MSKAQLFSIWIIYFLSILAIHLAESNKVYDFGLLLNMVSFLGATIYYEVKENKEKIKEKAISKE